MKALWKLFTYSLNALGHKACPKFPWSCHCYGVKLNYFYNACCTLAKWSLFPHLTEVEGFKNKWIKKGRKKVNFHQQGENPFFLKCEEGKLKRLSSKCQPGTLSHCFKREMVWLAGDGLIIVKNKAFAVCMIFLVVVIDKDLSPTKNQEHEQLLPWWKWLWDVVGWQITKLDLVLICVLSIGLNIKWMRLSEPEISTKTRQACSEHSPPASKRNPPAYLFLENKTGFVIAVVLSK